MDGQSNHSVDNFRYPACSYGDLSRALSLGERVKKAREVKGFSVSDLSIRSGVAQSAIRCIEKNKMRPKNSTLRKLRERIDFEWDEGEVYKPTEGRNNKQVEGLGKAIRDARLARRLSQGELSRLSGVSQKTIYNIEHGHKGQCAEAINEVQQYLGVKYMRPDDAKTRMEERNLHLRASVVDRRWLVTMMDGSAVAGTGSGKTFDDAFAAMIRTGGGERLGLR